MNNFWQKLEKPVVAIAPMADVTDPAFRSIIAKYGKPDVFWTEFVAADGLYHTREIQKLPDEENPLMLDLVYGTNERPIVAQIFSGNPEMIEYAAALMVSLGFDGVDINMGCPHRAIEKQGAGAHLMKEPELAAELIRAAKRGTEEKIPVSVKTRIGYTENVLDTWLPVLLDEQPAVVTVHARTRKEMSKVPARWEHIAEAVAIRDSTDAYADTLIMGNGDVESIKQAKTLAKDTGADGVMIGRGIFGNPWLFAEHVPTVQERLRVLLEHCELFDRYCAHKSYAVMKKHFKAYVTGFPGSKELRTELFNAKDTNEVGEIIKRFLKNNV